MGQSETLLTEIPLNVQTGVQGVHAQQSTAHVQGAYGVQYTNTSRNPHMNYCSHVTGRCSRFMCRGSKST